MFDISFWKDFLSNFLATFIGAIVGVPIALWLNKKQQQINDSSEKDKIESEARKRKIKILRLIYAELDFDKAILEQYPSNKELLNEQPDIKISAWLAYGLKFESWKALSDGGELQWIDDATLLFNISWAYYGIRNVREVCNSLINAKFISKPDFGEVVTEFMESHAAENVVDTLQHVTDTLEKIKEILEKSRDKIS